MGACAIALGGFMTACGSDAKGVTADTGDAAQDAAPALEAAGEGDALVFGGVVDVALDGCNPPAGSTALCVSFRPESIRTEAEPGLDGRGSLLLEVFDTPTPDPGGNPEGLLYRRTFPATSSGELALSELPSPTLVVPDAFATVFVRALFFDGRTPWLEAGQGLAAGTWVAGLDLSRGLVADPALLAIPLARGQVTAHEMPLTAMRRLLVTVTTSIAPLGDGEGALSVVASRAAGLPPNVPTHGYGIAPCVDMAEPPARVEVLVLGSGTFFVTAFFEDLGIETPGAMPPGTLLSADALDGTADASAYDTVTLNRDQYAAELTIDLRYASELPDGTPIPPNSCGDLGLPEAT